MDRRQNRHLIPFGLFLLVLALLPGPAGAQPEAAAGARVERRDAPRTSARDGERLQRQARRFTIDFEFSALRFGIAGAGLGLFGWGLWLRRRAGESAFRRTRRAALVGLALASYGSYYYFFQLHHVGGIDAEDAFQYYTASKYFPELGYFGLYDCTFTGLVEDGIRTPGDVMWVRDLRTLRVKTAGSALARGRACREAFGEARWQSFKHDAAWFNERMSQADFEHLMIDRGFQPTPVWTLFGRGISSLVPVDSGGLRHLVRGDRVLIAVALLAIGWAFGLETACLAAIVWGTGFNWRYSWIGDNFFRLPWLASSLIGLCLLRRGRPGASGAFLALAGLLRIFPGAFAASYLLGALRRSLATRRVEPEARRFVFGALVLSALTLAASVLVSGRGFGVFLEFAHKISTFVAEDTSNAVGLSVLVPDWLRWPITALFLAGFWRALRDVEGWEAAAMGFCLIPVLTTPTNYYHSYVVAGALLASRRPRLAVWLLLACLAWAANGLAFYRNDTEWVGASIIAVALAAATILEMALPAARQPESSTAQRNPVYGSTTSGGTP